MIEFCQFELDSSVVAPVIYKDLPHRTTSVGLKVSKTVQEELQKFLQGFLEFHGRSEHDTFIRVDAFFSQEKLYIIELNVELADGWGVALNLARACNGGLVLPNTKMPSKYVAYSSNYLPEYQLAIEEFRLLGHSGVSIETHWGKTEEKDPLDNKLALEQFSRTQIAGVVGTPRMYSVENTPWVQVPEDVVFKFTEKYGSEATRARYSVKKRSGIGKGEFMRKCYNRGRAIAQERIEPRRLSDGSVTQAIIMCSGSTPVTGYLQVAEAREFIINDRTARKGPLLFT